MNLPNKITLFRVFAIPVFLICYLWGNIYAQTAAFIIFVVASLSDALDGYIARKRNLITNFGKLMDPLADKLLVSSALIAMTQTGALPAWAAVVIIAREFFISGYRQLALENGVVLAASKLAKFKTAAQMCMALFLLFPFNAQIVASAPFAVVKWLLVALSVILSALSAIEYVLNNKGAVRL